jgi:hypothetical protein
MVFWLIVAALWGFVVGQLWSAWEDQRAAAKRKEWEDKRAAAKRKDK